MNSTSRRIRGILFAFVGLSGLAVAALLEAPWGPMGLGVAFVFFFLAGTALSKATSIAGALRPYVKQTVRVEVWGAAIPASSDSVFEIVATSSFGAALYFRLRPTGGGPSCLMKVAQPGSAKLEGRRIEIAEAAYVSWAGVRIKPAAGRKMPAVVLLN